VPESRGIATRGRRSVLSHGAGTISAAFALLQYVCAYRNLAVTLLIYQLGVNTGMVVAVPNPAPADGEVIEAAINVRMQTLHRGACLVAWML
jgi:hypothetical protein